MVLPAGRAIARAVAALVLSMLVLLMAAGPARAAPTPPNIVLILADDLGYGELGAYGVPDAPTPRIDALAAGGVRLTDGYTSSPQCAPTRAGLLTGRHQQRFGFYNNPPAPTHPTFARFGLPPAETTLAQELQRRGYATGIVGKWHLGFGPEHHPLRRGFDTFFGFLSGGHSYVGDDPGNPILRDRTVVAEAEYLTRAFAREAASFIDAHAERPFFLYLPFNTVHLPLQAEPSLLAQFAHITDPKRRTFLAMLASFDEAVGAVVDSLRARRLLRRTLIVLTSDNGCVTGKSTCRNLPLSGGKGRLTEGGIRVPLIMSWPGVLPAGTTYDRPASLLDLFPTLLAAATGSADANATLDGVDLLPFLKGEVEGDPHAQLFWGGRYFGAVRSGSWKLMFDPGGRKLFDLATDIGETTDLAATQPLIADELQRAHIDWAGPLPPPRWPSAPP